MAKWMVNGHEVGGTINTASSISCTDKDGNLSNVQDELDTIRNNGTEQYTLLDERINEVFQLGTSRKAQLISSLPSKFGLTADSTWNAIFEKLAVYYPATFDILSNFSSSNWSYTQSDGTFTYTKGVSAYLTALYNTDSYCDARSSSFDITPFSKITCTWSQTGTQNFVRLITSDGEINLTNGTTDISKYSGDAKIRIYCHSYADGSGYYARANITVNSIILKA